VAIQWSLEDLVRDSVRGAGEPLGLSPRLTKADLQSDVFKELINKLAWVLGSTYEVKYSTTQSKARQAAMALARLVLKYHGYPRSIEHPLTKVS